MAATSSACGTGRSPPSAPTARPVCDGGRPLMARRRAWIMVVVGAAVVAAALHLVNPFRHGLQAALLALVLVHALLGVRALLLDVGLPLRWHRALFVLALLAAGALFIVVWRWRWY